MSRGKKTKPARMGQRRGIVTKKRPAVCEIGEKKRRREVRGRLLASTSSSSVGESQKLVYVICCCPIRFRHSHLYSIYKIDINDSDDYLLCESPPPLMPFITLDKSSFAYGIAFAILNSKLYLFGGTYALAHADEWEKEVFILDSLDFGGGSLLKESLRQAPMNGAKDSPVAIIIEGLNKIFVFSTFLKESEKYCTKPNFEVFDPIDESWFPLPELPFPYPAGRDPVEINAYCTMKTTIFVSAADRGIYSIDVMSKLPSWTSIQFSSGVQKFPFNGRGIIIGNDNICITSDHLYDVRLNSSNSLKKSFPIFCSGEEEIPFNVVRLFIGDLGAISSLGQPYFCSASAGFPFNSPHFCDGEPTYPSLQLHILCHKKG